jgi:hypothetical protein
VDRRIFVVAWWTSFIAGALVLWFFLRGVDILPLEFAANGDAARAVIDGYGDKLAAAKASVWWDFAYIVCYGATLLLGVSWASRVYLTTSLRSFGVFLAPLVPVAMLLDGVENVALLRMLAGKTDSAWPAVAAACAYPKFLIVLAAIPFLLGGVITRVYQWLRPHLRIGPDLVDLRRDRDASNGPWEGGDVPSWAKEAWEPQYEKIGISCSGGGIRSAAYNLGALQTLQAAGKLDAAAYIACVSGGGYMAGAWAIMRKESQAEFLRDVPAYSTASPEEDYLRNHSSYLAPTLGAKLWGLTRFLLGTGANFVFIALLIALVARPFGWIISLDYLHPSFDGPTGDTLRVTGAMWLSIGAIAIAAILLATTVVMIRIRVRLEEWFLQAAKRVFVLAVVLFFVLVGLPWLVRTVPVVLADPSAVVTFQSNDEDATSDPEKREGPSVDAAKPLTPSEKKDAFNLAAAIQAIAGFVTLVTGAIAALGKRKGTVLYLIGRAVPPLTIAFGFVMVAYSGANSDKSAMNAILGMNVPHQIALWILTLLGFWLFYLVTDQTAWSLHAFYKRRLATAFALRRVARDRVEELPWEQPMTLSEYPKPSDAKGPQLVVCTAANLSDQGLTPVGRRSVSCTFSSTEVGGRQIGWLPTATLEDALRPKGGIEHMTLIGAMAISGAAVSPAMGKFKESKLGPLFALVNARLGVWFPNPKRVGQVIASGYKWADRPRATFLLRELTRTYPLDNRFLYVTDGGHWENLGLVELLRRGCTEIYCFDATGDKVDTFTTVGQALAIARTELDVKIDIDLGQDDPLDEPIVEGGASRKVKKATEKKRRDPREASHDHWWGIIQYPNGVKGKLVVVKLAVTDDAPWHVRAYAAADPQFPCHGTLDQLFDHEKFEAYRALGESSCEHALEEMRKGFFPALLRS